MANTFEGNPDARQGDSTTEPVSRFRPTYRALTDEEKALHDEIKAKAVEMETLFGAAQAANNTGVSARYFALANTQLELAVMWAVKALTS